MFKFSIFIFLFFSISVHSATYKEEALTVGYVEFPPLSYTNADGKADGSLIHLATKLLNTSGHQYKFIALPSKRVMAYLPTGVIDLWIGIDTHEKLRDFAIVGKQIISKIKLNIYSTNIQNKVVLADLNNKSVIIIRGFNYGGILNYLNNQDNKITTFITNTHHSAFNMLLAKRSPYMIAYEAPVNIELEKQKINLHSSEIFELPLYLTISKKTPNAEALLKRLEEIFLQHKRE